MQINKKIMEELGIVTDVNKIVISKGLKSHIEKHNHKNVLKYFDKIQEILESPDYIGINPRKKQTSLECIKILDDNVLVAVKLDTKRNYFYTPSMYDITDSKLKTLLESGRIKKYKI